MAFETSNELTELVQKARNLTPVSFPCPLEGQHLVNRNLYTSKAPADSKSRAPAYSRAQHTWLLSVAVLGFWVWVANGAGIFVCGGLKRD